MSNFDSTNTGFSKFEKSLGNVSSIKTEPCCIHEPVEAALNQDNELSLKLEKFSYKNEKKFQLSGSNIRLDNTKKTKRIDINGNEIDVIDLNTRIKNVVSTEINDESPKKKVKWEPPLWQDQYQKIREMRKDMTAPVDTLGCDAIASIEPNITENVKRYHVLVSLMLSAQTKDEVTAKAMAELQKLPLTIDTFLNTSTETLEKCIYPVSFYKRKVQYIKKTSQILKDEYEYDIPDNVKDLMKLPGVGPKMAYITMSCAWKSTVGIGVDTHVHRIANRLGWTRTTTKQPEQTRKELEDWLPQSLWADVNHMLVGFGQQTCRPIGPKCGNCSCRDLCPVGKNFVNKKSKKVKIIKISKE